MHLITWYWVISLIMTVICVIMDTKIRRDLTIIDHIAVGLLGFLAWWVVIPMLLIINYQEKK